MILSYRKVNVLSIGASKFAVVLIPLEGIKPFLSKKKSRCIVKCPLSRKRLSLGLGLYELF